ncbi:MAG: DUF5615 family PIN-like protein [Candidatus Binatia bacterium]
MRIKLDENLGRPHITLLKRHGYEANRIFDQGLSGIEDTGLWLRVRRENRFFITLDLGFSDVRRYTPGTHPGILLLRPRRKGRGNARSAACPKRATAGDADWVPHGCGRISNTRTSSANETAEQIGS